MILEYHRPTTIDEALTLLKRDNPHTVPLGGGTTLSQKGGDPVAVVDLQALGLDFLRVEGSIIEAGAMVRMHKLASLPQIQPVLMQAITTEYSSNLREMTTIGGAIVANGGRSAFLTALLALDAKLIWLPGESEYSLGDYLPVRRSWDGGSLIRSVKLPENVKLKSGICRSNTWRPADFDYCSLPLAFRPDTGRTWRIWRCPCACNRWPRCHGSRDGSPKCLSACW